MTKDECLGKNTGLKGVFAEARGRIACCTFCSDRRAEVYIEAETGQIGAQRAISQIGLVGVAFGGYVTFGRPRFEILDAWKSTASAADLTDR